MKNEWLIIGGLIILLIIGYMVNKDKNNNNQGENVPPVEEVITQEDGSVVKKIGDQITQVSPEEMELLKKEISDNLSNATLFSLLVVEGKQGSGTTASFYNEETGIYYQKVEIKDMLSLDKGYYYEAWLKDENGNKTSIGRVEMTNYTDGQLLYRSNNDKSGQSVMVSYEIEDGNSEMGELILSQQ